MCFKVLMLILTSFFLESNKTATMCFQENLKLMGSVIQYHFFFISNIFARSRCPHIFVSKPKYFHF